MTKTWLCTFDVKIDLPVTMTPQEMEAAVASCLSVRLPALGFAGNCVVTLTATAGNVSVLDGPALDGSVKRVDNPGTVGVLPGPVPVGPPTIEPTTPEPDAGPITPNPIGGA